MTRMRVVGLLGISAVLGGFGLVVWKILKRRGFVWLVQRQLWIVAVMVWVGAVLPVDYLVHRYNATRIMSGDSAPSVQLSVHPIDPDGLLSLLPLVDCPDETVRRGVRAMLAEADAAAEARAVLGEGERWTTFQLADRVLSDALRSRRATWAEYADAAKRREALVRFHSYAYQWY